ncbi:MAG: cytochrome c maturation protein CcmE [Armatimonadetes bacterium]|nr:cytochrome c maturation protein CcmE [Armatimonadota bacterium]
MKSKKQLQVTLGVSVIVVLLGWLVYDGTKSSSMRYFEVKEIAAESANLEGKQVRMRGKVRTGSIEKNSKDLEVRFVIQDDQGHVTYPVLYKGIVPDTFKDGSEVVVDGTFHATGSFEATQLQAKCPSKYEMKDRVKKGSLPKDHSTQS